jgi:hypothetical protein
MLNDEYCSRRENNRLHENVQQYRQERADHRKTKVDAILDRNSIEERVHRKHWDGWVCVLRERGQHQCVHSTIVHLNEYLSVRLSSIVRITLAVK